MKKGIFYSFIFALLLAGFAYAGGFDGNTIFFDTGGGKYTLTVPAISGSKTITLPNTTGTLSLTTGNTATATALAADPANCTSGQAAGGIVASGAAEACLDPILSTEIDASSEIAAIVTDETGTGSLVFGTSPRITTSLLDANGATMFGFTPATTAVNYFQFFNSATGVVPVIRLLGTDTNISLSFDAKGSGVFRFQNQTATDDTIAIQPKTGGGAYFTGYLTSADLTTADKTWTLPDATGTIDLNCTASHDYAAGVVDWTMTASEAACSYITATNASGAVIAILPAATPGKTYTVNNASGQVLTFKVTGQTGGTIASAKWGLYTTLAADVVEVYELP